LPGAAVELHNWLPNAGKRSTQELFELSLSRGEALDTVARAHGFANWQEAEVAERNAGDPVFERAIEDLLAGDVPGLVGALDRVPDLVVRRSHYGHRATLLHYLAANGVEIYRQRVPLNASAIAAILVERGADVLATANMYGKNQTMRGLLLSSAHPRAAGVTDALLALIDRPPPHLNLVVLRSSDIDRGAAFYRQMGLLFTKHAHGTGPEHYSSEVNGLVFELYPLTPKAASTTGTRIGFRVDSVDRVVELLTKIGAVVVSTPTESEWGRRAVVKDFDGHIIELVTPKST